MFFMPIIDRGRIMLKHFKKTISNNRGVAMTEVVVSFLILTIILGLVYSCIRFSSNMLMKATDVDRENEEYQEKLSTMFTDTEGRLDYDIGGTLKTMVFTDDSGNSYTFETYAIKEEVTLTEGSRYLHLYSTTQ